MMTYKETVVKQTIPKTKPLVSAQAAHAIDQEAAADWGLEPFALVEAAGRNCARVLTEALKQPPFAAALPPRYRTAVFAGSGNNAADALVLLKALILEGYIQASLSRVIVKRLSRADEHNPRSEALKALIKMGVPVSAWDAFNFEAAVLPDLIIDGIAGTGLQGPLEGVGAQMLTAINSVQGPDKPLVIAIDMPSGNGDAWQEDWPIIHADLTLAIEPLKACIYTPAARPFAGTILHVGGIFPAGLLTKAAAELLTWEALKKRITPVSPAAYKQKRGLVEIRAGSTGLTGAARIAARGAQAAGAGLIRLVVDESIYPILAASAGGIMVAPDTEKPERAARFTGDAILLGPGWGKTSDRSLVLQRALEQETAGVPLILDADAIAFCRAYTFHGNCILTPHPGEFAAWSGLSKKDFMANPVPLLSKCARTYQVTLLFKSHVMYIAAADGRLGILDGMTPVLAAGGSGDLLAGICAAIAARMKASASDGFDGYTCAAAAAALLLAAAAKAQAKQQFTDPFELADIAAGIAGAAWL
ncbi:NAD(P)H-hydrate epimerase [Breznakiellaceae bacterium SP9]